MHDYGRRCDVLFLSHGSYYLNGHTCRNDHFVIPWLQAVLATRAAIAYQSLYANCGSCTVKAFGASNITANTARYSRPMKIEQIDRRLERMIRIAPVLNNNRETVNESLLYLHPTQ